MGLFSSLYKGGFPAPLWGDFPAPSPLQGEGWGGVKSPQQLKLISSVLVCCRVGGSGAFALPTAG